MSLLDAAERFASIDCSQISLETRRCLHSLDQFSDCRECFALCPVQAIIEGKPPRLDPERCQSCLACLPVCPVGAYHADDDVSSLLNCVTHLDGETVEVLCGLHPLPEMGTGSDAIGIQIRGCLAGLGMGAYMTLFALGIPRILVRTDACRACRWQTLSSKVYCQTEQAARFLSARDGSGALIPVEEIVSPVARVLWKAGNPPLSRRDLFRMLARQGQIAMARALENKDSGSHRQPGRDRRRLTASLSHLAKPSAEIDLNGLRFAVLTVSDSCTACGACGKACPTQALRFEKDESETRFSISFSAMDCIACELCDHVCLPDAILLDRSPAYNQVFESVEAVIVRSGRLVRCARCRTPMAERQGAKLCPLCEYRLVHPFGSVVLQKAIKRPRS